MSRTPLFAAVKKALAVASHENGVVWPRTSALTRRQLLRLSAAATGAPALAPVLDRRAYAKKPGPSSIAIVGVVVAGLTAAYRLQQHGAKPVLFEASNRWGGRMFTQYDLYKGMFCELGGEFVGTGHEDCRTSPPRSAWRCRPDERVAEPQLWSSRAFEWHVLFRSRLPESVGDEPRSAGRGRHHHRLFGVQTWTWRS